MSTNQFTQLLTKEMTRKEFLVHMGLLLFVLTGISGLLKTLSNPHITKNKNITSGFGSGPYGG